MFKIAPWKHQADSFERFKDAAYAALFLEQRLGKTAVALAIAAHKYLRGEIDTLLIVAPNDIHYQWVNDAIPEHLAVPHMAVLWRASKIKQVAVRAQLKELLNYGDGLRVLAINVDALDTVAFSAPTDGYANFLFAGHRVMTVIDESSDIGTASAARTKKAIRLGRASRARLILDGTPASAGPLGLYGQCQFLSPDALGFDSFVTFRAHYAELERRDFGERTRKCPDCRKPDGKSTGRISASVAAAAGLSCSSDVEVRCARCWGTGLIGKVEAQVVKTHVEGGEKVKSYRNLDELNARLAKFSVRLTRAEAYDLPPKIYNKLYFELQGEQRRVYEDLRERFRAELRSGAVVTAAMVLTRYLRLQQVSSGFLPAEKMAEVCPTCGGTDPDCLACEGLGFVVAELDEPKRIESLGVNPRLDLFVAELRRMPGPGIVWATFNYDVDSIVRGAREAGRAVVQFDGRVSAKDKAAAVAAFQAGHADLFVAKQRSAGRGQDLARAEWSCYYSHGWSLRMRLQSEDRAQSLKKTTSVGYLDLVGVDTVDERIVAALRAGKRLSDTITGDRPEDWL